MLVALDDLLSRFDGLMLDERHRALTRRALEWSLRHAAGSNHREHAKEAFLASTFGMFCAPPSATLKEIAYSVQFLVVFWKGDEASSGELDELVAWLDGPRDREPSDVIASLWRCHEALLSGLREIGRDTTHFRKALRRLFLSMRAEKQADKEALSERAYRELRREVIGIGTFSECWMTIRGLSLGPELEETLRRSGVLDLTSDLVYLANDIGSFDKDEKIAQADAREVDLNLVRIRARALGDRRAAMDEVVDLYNAKVAEFVHTERLLLASRQGDDPVLRAYLEILRSSIDGNLATTKHLVPVRYEGAMEPLSRLAAP